MGWAMLNRPEDRFILAMAECLCNSEAQMVLGPDDVDAVPESLESIWERWSSLPDDEVRRAIHDFYEVARRDLNRRFVPYGDLP